jgi:5-methylthioadenosine/S-adenosylhomocysteine deaminase
LKWEHSIGSLETGKLADLLVVGGKSGDPYAHLITAHEAAVKLVMIDGVARYGTSAAFDFLNTPPSESWTVRHKKRALNLTQASADPIVGALTLTAACDRLSDGLHRLPEIARQKANPAIVPAQRLAAPKWSLTLDHDEPAGVSIRPRFSATAARCCTSRISAELPIWAAKPDAEVVGPMTLDPITVDDDPDFIATLKKAINLPPIFADELVELLS